MISHFVRTHLLLYISLTEIKSYRHVKQALKIILLDKIGLTQFLNYLENKRKF